MVLGTRDGPKNHVFPYVTHSIWLSLLCSPVNRCCVASLLWCCCCVLVPGTSTYNIPRVYSKLVTRIHRITRPVSCCLVPGVVMFVAHGCARSTRTSIHALVVYDTFWHSEISLMHIMPVYGRPAPCHMRACARVAGVLLVVFFFFFLLPYILYGAGAKNRYTFSHWTKNSYLVYTKTK